MLHTDRVLPDRKLTQCTEASSLPNLSLGTPYQAFLQTYVGALHWQCDLVRLCVFPLRMACSRKGRPSNHHPV